MTEMGSAGMLGDLLQSSHHIDLDQPELVIKEINRILEMA
jgi:hypothetical protein